jgi:hypothetical protein
VIIDGEKENLVTYEIAKNNYFSVSELAEVIGFTADWDGAKRQVVIETSDYVEPPPPPPPESSSEEETSDDDKDTSDNENESDKTSTGENDYFETQNRYGTLTYSNGVYTGNLVNGVESGQGIMTWDNGDKYDGNWVDGVKSGQGTYTWENGNKYEGDFVDGKLDGRGTMTYADGTVKSGQWKDGEFIG